MSYLLRGDLGYWRAPSSVFYSCNMATIDPARRFAEQAVKVDRILHESGATGNAGRIILLLTMANVTGGVPQKRVLDDTALPKDVLSKLVASLVRAGLLTQERNASDPRMKTLLTSDSGRQLLSRVKTSLQSPRPASPRRKPQRSQSLSFFDLE